MGTRSRPRWTTTTLSSGEHDRRSVHGEVLTTFCRTPDVFKCDIRPRSEQILQLIRLAE